MTCLGAGARLDGREVVEEEHARQLVAGGHIALLEVLCHRVLVGEDGAVADVPGRSWARSVPQTLPGFAGLLATNTACTCMLCCKWRLCMAGHAGGPYHFAILDSRHVTAVAGPVQMQATILPPPHSPRRSPARTFRKYWYAPSAPLDVPRVVARHAYPVQRVFFMPAQHDQVCQDSPATWDSSLDLLRLAGLSVASTPVLHH